MRIRSVKPDFWRSSDISALSIEDRLLFIGLWSYVDDNGVGIDRLALITADLFADDLSRDPPETLARVSRGLSNLVSAGLIVRYDDPESPVRRSLLFIVSWDKHQRVDKPNKPRYARPTREYGDTRETLAEPSRDPRETLAPGAVEQRSSGTEEQVVVGGAPKHGTPRATRLPDGWTPHTDLIAQMRAECPHVDVEAEHRKFTDYWRAKSGKDATKLDWSATWRNWIRNTRPSPKSANGQQAETDDQFDRMMQRAQQRDQAKALES